ncbi:MAG: sugar kinase [Proteobacteria bacterium]|nr:sugar kinase [Pseudomonadota bacterium]MBI3499345.1 sugar kinase [Pseudomonadota bacterium]
MIELSHLGPSHHGVGQLGLAFGGDTLNTAVYLARLGQSRRIAVDYITALGDDPYSEAMLAFWQQEGIGTDLVARLPGRLPGLYMIRTDDQGERSFFYWRSAAAARDMLVGPRGGDILARLKSFDWLYLSGITLSILGEVTRLAFLRAVEEAKRAGTKIAFDTNYRPRGWVSPETARFNLMEALRLADLAMPSLDDERLLFGDADTAACAQRLHALGVPEVVVKDAKGPCLVSVNGEATSVMPESVTKVIDSTAAGDSFNAAYLAERIAGGDPIAAARAGHRLAGQKIQHRGAIIPLEAMPADATSAVGE